jgi:heptosyltransferase-3
MEMTDSKKAKVFLICHPGALGDFILTWPALLSLKKHLREHSFIAVGRGEYMKLAVRFGLIDDFMDMDSRESVAFFTGDFLPSAVGRPAVDRPDGAVLWMKDAGPTVDLVRKTATLPVIAVDPIPRDEMHVAKYYCRTIGNHLPVDIPEPLYRDFPEHEPKSRYAFIHPGSGSGKKNFTPDLYKNIALELKMNGYDKIAFLMGPAEIESGLSDFFRSKETIFPESVVGLTDWLQNASLYIGNDSGVSHLAGFLGIPSIVLYKATDPKIWGVVGRHVHIITMDNEESTFYKIQQQLKQNNTIHASG